MVTPKERPIIFSAPMVKAILDGKKTQTRRPVNLDRLRVRVRGEVRGDPPLYSDTKATGTKPARMNQHGAVAAILPGKCSYGPGPNTLGLKPGEFDFVCPYADGRTHLADHGGERKVWTITPEASSLWVRETWAPFDAEALRERDRAHLFYRADHPEPLPDDGRWRSPRFMPRWASRITLVVTSVRVERLQAITEEDARAEGVDADLWRESHRHAFAVAWDSINGERAPWSTNPWIWRIEFHVLRVDDRAQEGQQ